MKSILTISVHPTIDVNTEVDHVIPEKKLRCAPPQFEPGGGGINVSRAIRKLGGESVAVYIAGGATGDLLRELITLEGIEHIHVASAAWTRENFIVFETSTTRQFRFGMPASEVENRAWDDVLDHILSRRPIPDFIVFSGSAAPGMPQRFFPDISRAAAEKGSRLIVDTSGDDLMSAVRAGGVYLIKPNLDELRSLTGRLILDELEIEEAGRRIIAEHGVEVVVISIGAAGAIYLTAREKGRVRAPTVPIKSKVGAGDSMVAGIVLSLARGMALSDAIRFGVATGASAVMTPGTELCRRNDAERLYKMLKEEGEARN